MHVVLILSLFLIYLFTGGDKSLSSQSARRVQVIWMGMALLIFAALRSYTVGTDVWGYFQDYYKDASYNSFSELWDDRQGRDPFFHCLLRVLSFISSNPQFMLLIIGGIVAFGFSYFSYYQKGNVLLFYVLFIGFRMYSFTLSGLRQACAMSLIYIAYTQLKKEKPMLFFVLVALAALFHQSALVALLIFIVFKIKNDRIVEYAAIIVAVSNIVSGGALAAIMENYVFQDRFSGYIERSVGYSDWGLTIIIYLVVYLLIILKTNRLSNNSVWFHEDFRLLTVAIMFAIIGMHTDAVGRMNYYFIFIIIPLFSQVLQAIGGKDVQTTRMLTWIVILLMSAQYLILGASGIQEYEFFWENPYVLS